MTSVAVSSAAPATGMAQSPDGAAAHREGAGNPPVGSLPVPPNENSSGVGLYPDATTSP